MGEHLRYTDRAECYAKYRWGYATTAVQAVAETARLDETSRVADVGSGTGILTRHFIGMAGLVYAVEPDAAMRAWAERQLSRYPSFRSIAGTAEATTLADGCADLITVGQAIHWFDPQAARREFRRILRPDGWLAILWNEANDEALARALDTVRIPAHGWDQAIHTPQPQPVPPDYYYGGCVYQHLLYPAERQETWEEFLGALSSDSHAPAHDHPCYGLFALASRRVFDAYARQGLLDVRYTTHLVIGVGREATGA